MTEENKRGVNAPKKDDSQNSLPEGLRSEGTKVKSFKKFIEDKLVQIKDLATLEVYLPIEARLKERLDSIKKMGSAESIKIRGHWKTTPPQMHITKLSGRKTSSDEAEITFSVFEVDIEGNKKLHEQQTEIVRENGDRIKRTTSAEYRIAYEVTEKIRTGKPIQREVLKFDLI